MTGVVTATLPAALTSAGPAADRDADVRRAIDTIARGGLVIIVDGPDREDEGDLVAAAELATPDTVNFMATHGRGLICAPVNRDRLDHLGIPPMPSTNTDPLHTAFHVGVDHRAAGTGISAVDRALAIRALADPTATAPDFRMPGHVFPLAAHPHGVLGRAGHTEAAVDIARLAARAPAAVICEIAAPDGTMARWPALRDLARVHDLPLITIDDLRAYRRRRDLLVERVTEAALPLAGGRVRVVGYRGRLDGVEHLALVRGDLTGRPGGPVAVHRECVVGEVFGSRRCGCRRRLDDTLERISQAEAGAVVYLRGGARHQIRDYLDAATDHEGPLSADERALAAQILRDLDVPDSA